MVLIIYAHPGKGHNKLVLDEVINSIENYELLDLYDMNFNPVLPKDEHYTSGKVKLKKEILDIQDKIKKHDKLIFIFPAWWSSMPAILKGFFDRVLTVHFAFRYKSRFPIKLLKGKKAVVFVTTGAPDILNIIFYSNTGLWAVKKDILGFCGIKSKIIRIDNALNVEANRKKIKRKVKKGLKWL